MPKKALLGDTYLDEINGYVIECVRGHLLFPGRTWVAAHRVRMAEKLKRPLLKSELVHHKDENKQNNDDSNLELTTRKEHPSHHRGQKRSEAFKAHAAVKARERCTPEWRAAVSKRVKDQHAAGKFGRQTWKD